MKMIQVFVIAILSALGNAQRQLLSAPAPSSTTETALVPVRMRAIVDALAGGTS
jgi:hypothetical protein